MVFGELFLAPSLYSTIMQSLTPSYEYSSNSNHSYPLCLLSRLAPHLDSTTPSLLNFF